MANKELFNGTPKTTIEDDENLAFEKPGQIGSLIITWLNFKSFLATLFMRLTGNQTADGIKTFVKSPIVPDPTTDLQAVNLRTLLASFAAAGTKENISTGISFGGELSINIDPTKFDIAAGKAIVVNSYSDPESPTFIELEWIAQNNIVVADIATQLITFVSVSDAGGGVPQFTQNNVTQNTTDNRDKIQLGVLVHENLASISVVSSLPNWNKETDLKVLDFAGAIGRINTDGNVYTPNGVNKQIDKSSGMMFGINSNYGNDKKSPNYITSSQEVGLTFLTAYGDSGSIIGSSNLIDTDNFNPLGDGGLIPIPDNLVTTHGIFFSPETGLTIVHYGQYLYDSIKNAVDAWEKEVYNVIPELEGVSLRGVIAFVKGATDLTDPEQAKFINPGAFGFINNKTVPTYSRYGETVELLNGLSNFPVDIEIIEDTSVIYAEVEREGGGDVDFLFNQREHTLDCTTGPGTGGKARIALTAGASATATQSNWVYAIKSGEVAILAVSANRPTGQFSYIYMCEIPNVPQFLITGATLEQRYNDAKSHDGRSTIERTNEWIRTRRPEYEDGLSQTVVIDTGPSPDSIDYTQTAGNAWQKHLQSIPQLQVSVDEIRIANHPITPFFKVADLNDSELLQDSSGVSLSGKSFNWVIWTAVNYKGRAQLFINLPVEADASAASAVSKQNNSDTSIPKKYKSVGILSASLPFSHSPAGGGTYVNLSVTLLGKQVIDLRGKLPDTTSGGSGGTAAINEFLDSLFRVISNVNGFKLQHILDNLTTDRQYTWPDKSGNVAMLADILEEQDITSGDQGAGPNYDVVVTHTRNKINPVFQLMNANGVVIKITMLNTGLSTTTFTLRLKHSIVGTYKLTII